MYSLFSNEKLGMPVEELRLWEIRKEIEAQRLGDKMNPTPAEHSTHSLAGWLGRMKTSISNLRGHKKPNTVWLDSQLHR